jgi:4-hydroxybenzoate polyprenyltransferase
MIWYLKLIRFPNLLMVLLTMVLTKYVLISSFTFALCGVQFILLAISILCITASGYIINDVFDVAADKINKPTKVFIGNTISKKNALLLYAVLSILGLILGMYASYSKGNILYSLFFIGTIGLLYWYSKSLKRIAVLGNIVIAFLVTLTIFIVYIFDVENTKTASNLLEAIANFFASISATIVVFIYGFFAFFMTLIREIIKDIEDMKGDYALKMKTLPILIGAQRTKNILLVISSLVFLFLLLLLKEELLHIKLLLWYTVLFIILPFAWFLYILFTSKTIKDFHLLSKLMKVIMLFGILSMVLLKF